MIKIPSYSSFFDREFSPSSFLDELASFEERDCTMMPTIPTPSDIPSQFTASTPVITTGEYLDPLLSFPDIWLSESQAMHNSAFTEALPTYQPSPSKMMASLKISVEPSPSKRLGYMEPSPLKSPKRKLCSLSEDDEEILKMLVSDSMAAQQARLKAAKKRNTPSDFVFEDESVFISEIRSRAIADIRAVGHHQSNKPRTTITIPIPGRAFGLKIMGLNGTVVSSSKYMDRIELSPSDIQAWLGVPYINDCKYSGKYRVGGNGLVDVYFESGEVKIRETTMIVEFRTFIEDYHNV